MSASSDQPAGPQDPFAPKRVRDQEQTRSLSDRLGGRPSRVEADDSTESEAQIPWRRATPSSVPPSLIGRAPVPRPEPRRSFMTQAVLLAAVSIVSALSVMAIYRFGNEAFPPAAAPQLASSSSRPVQTVTVTPPATAPAQDERSSTAAPATAMASASAAVPASPATATTAPPAAPAKTAALEMPRAAAVRGVTDTEIRFGISAPFSGSARELGRQMKLGLDTAFGAINDAGGINGRQLRLVAVDDGYEPSRTLDAMKDLVEKQGVFGLVGNVGTPTATVALPYALQQRMLFFGAFTGAGLLRRDPPDRYVFNYRASYAEETEATVNYLVKVRRLKPEQIAVFAQQDGYGDSGYAGVVKAVRALNGDPDKILRLNYKRNTVDVDEAVAALRAHKRPIKAIIMVPTYRAAARFIEKTYDLFRGMIYTNVSFVGSTALAEELKLLGPKYAEGVIVTQVVPAIDGYSSFVLEYKNALATQFPGEASDYVSLEGYVAGNLLAEGLRRSGPQVDTEKLVDALESLRNYDAGLGTPLTFGRTEHQASHKIWGTQLGADGHYQPFDMQ
jgi:branched-chain amino acid transport system substrate-binding protein